MRTMNDSVLLVPFTERGVIVSKTTSGIPFIGNYDHLVKSVALADGPDGIKTGDTVYVSGTQVKAPWAKVAFDLGNGTVGVLAPRSAVVLVECAPVGTPKEIGALGV